MKNIYVKFLLGLVLVFGGGNVMGQIALYTENFGTTTVFPTGWSSSNITDGWSASTASASTTYTGASGGTNILFNGTGTKGQVHTLTYANNLSTIGYNTITIIWGGRGTPTFNSPVTFEWSANGTVWNSVSYSAVLGGNSWAWVNLGVPIALPAGAEGLSNLRFRWSTDAANSGNYRIDDITVKGTLAGPTITPSPTSLTGLSYQSGFGASAAQTFTLAASNLTAGGGNITITPPASGNYEISVTSATTGYSTSALTLPYTGTGTLASNTVWVRLKAGLAINNYNSESIGITGGGAPATSVTVSGDVFSPLASAITDYFRTNVTLGDWATPATWQSSHDNSTWFTATSAPTSAANTITIQLGNTVGLTSSVSMDQVVINGILEIQSGGSITLANGTGDDITIANGGILRSLGAIGYTNDISYASSANIHILSGGRITVGIGGALSGSGFNQYATDNTNTWDNGSIFEWNTTDIPAISNITFFPSASSSTKPVLLITKIGATYGGGSPIIINGILEVNYSFTLQGGGTKTLRDGITGTASLTLDAALGTTTISGTSAIIGGTGLNIIMNHALALTSGVTVPLGKDVKISSTTSSGITKGIDGIFKVDGTLDLTDVTVANTTGSVIVNGVLKTSKTNGLYSPGNIASGTLTINDGSTIEYNATVNQAITATLNYYNITFSVSGTKALASGFNPAGTVLIQDAAIVDAAYFTFGDAGTALTMTGGRFRMSGTGTKPDIDGVYTLTGGVVEFYNNALTAQTIKGKNAASADIVYNNIEVTGKNVGNSNSNITLGNLGSFTVKPTGIFTINDNAIVGPTGTQTLTVETGGLFKCGNDLGFNGPNVGTNSPSVRDNIETIILQTNSTVEYSKATSTGNQVITTTIPYQNLTLSGIGNKTAPSSTLEVKGNLTGAGSAAFVHNNGNVLFSGSASQTYSATVANPFPFYSITNSNNVNLITTTNLSVAKELILNPLSKLNLSAGLLTLKSVGALTARVGEITTATISYGSGLFEIERGINVGTDGTRKTWQFLATPVQNEASVTIRNNWQEGGALPAGYGTWITDPVYTTTTANGFDDYTSSTSLKNYNSSSLAWDKKTNTNGPIFDARGYMIFVRGDRTIKTFSGAANATNLRIRGKIYDGVTQPATTAITAGVFESIGNPYASAVDFTKVKNTKPIANDFIVWDPTLSGTYTVGGYQTISGTTGFITTPGSTTNYPDSVDFRNIQSGQAFFVTGTGTGSISFTESMKTSDSRIANRGPVQNNGVNEPIKMLSTLLFTANDLIADGNRVVFNNEYANAIDGDDAIKFGNSGENFGINKGSKTLSVEGRQDLQVNDTIFYKVSNLNALNYKLKIAVQNLVAPELEAELVDKFANTRTPVSLIDSTIIPITVTSDPASAASDRFMLVFKQTAGPLPVTFVSIAATRNADRTIAVTWKVENEINLDKYVVERSADGRTFTGILTKDVTNSTAYTQNDLSPLSADNYYRIKAISKDGKVQYSTIVKVAPSQTAASISVYPNPAVGKTLQVQFTNQSAGKYQLLLTNKIGQVLYKGVAQVAGNSYSKGIELNATTVAGVYQLKIVAENGTVTTQQVVVE